MDINTIDDLVACAVALGAEAVPGLSLAEQKLVSAARPAADVAKLQRRIRRGDDPLGEAFCRIRSAQQRRSHGQTYTPAALVDAMTRWATEQLTPARVVDPGTGSGRYLLKAGAMFPSAQLIGADIDPVATLMARANLHAAGFADRTRIMLADYRELQLEKITDPTVFIGNPPYVRHHGITPQWKKWLTQTAQRYGYRASQLAGLHAHFFLATLAHSAPGDIGTFVTSAEWLDVNYGALIRQLLTDSLGGESVHIMDPAALPFADANTTAAITCFSVGRKVASVKLRSVTTLDKLSDLSQGHPVKRERLDAARRWTPLLCAVPQIPEGFVELGELASVHRGAVTGANKVWVTTRDTTMLPSEVLHASVTKAKELFAAGATLDSVSNLRMVIDLPVELDELKPKAKRLVESFLRRPEVKQAKDGYIASSRKAWWSVGLRAPAPILATYMARRPPAFVRNAVSAHHINIAHGIYLRQAMSEKALSTLVDYLRISVTLGQGRTYAGGLTKFEPREMERLPVPALELLNDASFSAAAG